MPGEVNKRDQNYVSTISGVDIDDDEEIVIARFNSDKELLTASNSGGLNLPNWDYVSMTLSAGDTTETFDFKVGGSGGVTVATIVVVYTTSDRDVLVSATKT